MYVANVYIRLCQIFPVMLDFKKFLVILIISSAVTFAEESKRYQVSTFTFFNRFLCEEWNSGLELHVSSSDLEVKSRVLPLIFSCSRSCLSGAMATLDRRCSRKFSTRWRRTSPFAQGETPEWIHPTSQSSVNLSLNYWYIYIQVNLGLARIG